MYSGRREGAEVRNRTVASLQTSVRFSGYTRPQLSTLLFILLALAFMSVPFFYWDGGILDKEATFFIQQYLRGGTVLQKVFDPYANDLRTYQARELSYFFDYLDAQSFRILLGYGIVVLIPASAVLASLVTLLAFYWGTSWVTPHLNRLTAFLVLLVYVTNFVYLVTLGVFYRSTKPLLASTLLATLFYVTAAAKRELQAKNAHPRFLAASFLTVFGLTSVMSLLDRQGFFYTLVISAGLVVFYLFRRTRVDLLAGACAASCFMLLYNLLIGPIIIQSINGYWPSFEYQRLSAPALFSDSRYGIGAVKLLMQSSSSMLGSLPLWGYGLAAVTATLAWHSGRNGDRQSTAFRWPDWRMVHKSSWSLTGVLVALAVGSQVLMLALMILRHPPVFDWPDHRLWYYPLPWQTVVLFGMVLAVHWLLAGASKKRIVAVNLLLIIIIISNVANWSQHRRVMLHSPWFPGVYIQSRALKYSLRERTPAPYLDREYRALYDFCVRRMPAEKSVRKDRALNRQGFNNLSVIHRRNRPSIVQSSLEQSALLALTFRARFAQLDSEFGVAPKTTEQLFSRRGL